MEVAAGLRANRLLQWLDDNTLAALAGRLERVELQPPQVLYEEGGPMAHAWFPVQAVLSVLGSVAGAGRRIEVGTIGREGVLGTALYLGSQRSPGVVFTQVPGAAYRMAAADFVRAAGELPALRNVLHRYTHAFLVQVAQGTACNRAHGPLQRCARWLLQTHDRVGGDEFLLTQEFLAQMLGERRATVSEAASTLQRRGLIRYSRGRIVVVNRAGLERAACACYRVVQAEYESVLGKP